MRDKITLLGEFTNGVRVVRDLIERTRIKMGTQITAHALLVEGVGHRTGLTFEFARLRASGPHGLRIHLDEALVT